MVRRIRICSTCSKRFIALHSTHFVCCRKRNDKNDGSPTFQAHLAASPPHQPRNQDSNSAIIYHECALDDSCGINFTPENDELAPRSNETLESRNNDESIRPFPSTTSDQAHQSSLHPEFNPPSGSHNNVVDLLSDDDDEDATSEHDDASEPILVDFIEDENDVEPNETAGLHIDDEDECTEAMTLDVDPTNRGSAVVEDPNICLVCGSSLALLTSSKSRIQHIKRCAKKHGVTASDVRFNDDYEQFVEVQDTFPGDQEEPSSSSKSAQLPRNPYSSKPQLWHGDASTTIQAASASVPNVNGILMAGARRVAKMAQIQKLTATQQGSRKRSRFNSAAAAPTFAPARSCGNCPKYKLIPGTDFCCDGFHYAKTSLTTNYFLTHFHSDHYGGISKHWNIGTIYCSIPTANLVHQQLGVDRKYLHPLPMHTPTIIASKGTAVTVTLLNANHCPGAIMFLFEVGKRVILHVGDFRWNYNIMSSQLPLRPYCRKPWLGQESTSLRRIDDLFLDTTYCDVQYDLPTQEECIQAVIKVAEKEMRHSNPSKRSNVLMLFGAYTIGKEAVYMSVAKALGLKVYVDKRRHRILSTLDWSAADISILTTDPKGTNIWVVPLGHINMKKLASYKSIHMKGFSRDFDRVVGFRPTGWSLSSKKHQSSLIGTTDKGPLTLHTVPYSEHSSFPELVECLETLNPKRIIPTVSVNKSQQQIDLLLSHWREKQASTFVHN